ncbi:MAG: polymer-forming cytoskeletal protein [Acidobacteriota bacterium]|jgi:cytoskeletal protein CcmA (bactofilin family)
MKFKRESGDEIVSLLGEGVEFQGELSFTHGIRVDGIVRGRVRSESSLVIGPKGKVDAEVTIRRIAINGEFRGTIRSSERVEIHKEGKVYGDIYTPCLIIDAGATFEGKCNMNEQNAGSLPVAEAQLPAAASSAGDK